MKKMTRMKKKPTRAVEEVPLVALLAIVAASLQINYCGSIDAA